ncbi:MAG: protein translocase subunit SecF [Bacilli bacterium]|nr:protein translocase subunit SecF [Bacilli bacterium]MDD4733723.1 protein translocase subunit SecF [Bacilli bacterium]
MKKKLIKNSFIVLIILVAMGLTFPMIAKNLKFGLDLQGGFEVLYQVKGIDGKKITPSVITGTYKTILKRIDILGVNEPVIIVEGNDRIRVQLAGIDNQDEARKILSQAATLTFRDVNDNLLMTSSVLKSGGAKIGQDEKGGYAVSLSVIDKDEFYKVTKKISESQDNRIVIWLDFDENKNSFLSTNNGSLCGSTGSNCLSAATVSQGFASDVIISGNFKYEEVEQLVDLINSGSLSVKLEEISSKTVTASFGEGTLDKTFKAGIIGILLVLILIIAIFNFSGLIASICIVAYTYFTLLSFWLFGGVLTLPGIAALIIGIGMAIDAPVITFARIKDELAKGSKLQVAYENGNKNSFMSIFDSNFTTLIVGVILFIFGESAIKGFATMLIISILVTMLIMVLFNRYLLALFVKTGYFDDKLKLFIKFNKKKKVPFYQKMDFIKYRKYFYAGTTILIIIGIVSFFTNGLNLGIDFKGGTSIAVSSNETIDVKKLENDINQFGYSIYEKEKIDNSLIFKVNETLTEENIAEMTNHFKETYNIDSEIGVVSNIVSKELVKNAIISFIIAIVAIGIYVSFRFEFTYSISGIIALIHDALMVVIFFSVFKLEVTSIFIASILSIIGYSINDTVVTFDKMREITKEKYKNTIKSKDDYKDIVNTSLKTVLERTIITTLTTICPVIGLMLFGPPGIINFNISMLVGLIFGVYSSIFLACQLWYDFSKKKIGKITKKKWFDEDEVEELRIKGINA